jgi:hypothetical protein
MSRSSDAVMLRRFRIVQRGRTLKVVDATSDYTALVRIAHELGLNPVTITGTYRLPACEPDEPYESPIYAVEER